ncbi:porphobilinogen deaminase [Aplysia californica]|uniref:hydroxymethylbilane synthase n=1 Tax=Aplysia californica TaxID=6500 RepID=A0ABM0JMR8_APLCA|nr:porphobilinogen deaminase [Aplysia californica]
MSGEQRIIRVGTRKSQLALIQTNSVIQMLKALDPTLKFETLPMTTTGDRILDSALSKIGEKSLFTKELENALLKNQVDFVVHSLKDLPTILPEHLVIGCVCKRDNPFDAVVMHPKHTGKTLKDLPPGSVIGTSSLRRAAQVQRLYPQYKIENIRGNLNTRFQKLAEQDIYDAIILAVAGLERMGWHHCISQILSPEECMFAVSQGAMAVECRQGDEATLALLNKIHDHTTTICCVAERAYLKQLEGGCSVPVSTFTEINEDNQLHIRGGVFSIDGKESVEHTVNTHLDFPPVDIPDGPSFVGLHCQTPSKKNQYTSAWAAGVQLAEEMIKNGADSILAVAKAATKHQIMEEHERMKLEKQLKQQQQLQQQLSGSEAGASSSSAHSSQMSAR